MVTLPARLAVFISGGGSNLQALIDASKRGDLAAKVVWVMSSNPGAYGLERAAKEGIETFVYDPKSYPTRNVAEQDLLTKLAERHVDFIALAGYLKMVPDSVVRTYRGRMANIHPALLPRYGGKGMYGHFVHEAVIASGDMESGPTVHLVDEVYDNGRILEQARVPVYPCDTVDTLAARVLAEEHKLYPRVLDNLIRGRYDKQTD
jgi:formyltetrahydrofolate-dependent phosphoribosylglycinamide formyltransferase